MESGPIVPRNNRGVSDEEWDSWIDFIFNEYIVKDRGLHETLKTLQQRNHNVTETQLRANLTKWGFQKNLKPKTWLYINKTMQERASEGKDSVAILSGKRLLPEAVRKKVNRNREVTMAIWLVNTTLVVTTPNKDPTEEGIIRGSRDQNDESRGEEPRFNDSRNDESR
ncbi:hypothetical protein F5B19DRAFT_498761 [Rostrohypoxylon terebratum]|nr:hypothetical protein F5B19DRAFT_498761 [Rostrohypoxylon terebratum]